MMRGSMLGWQEVIFILGILLLVFGPTELPKLARDLGRAWNEFNKASSGVISNLTSPQTKGDEEKTMDEDKSKHLTEIAKKLDVNAEGKTDEQLTNEILTKILNREEKPTTT